MVNHPTMYHSWRPLQKLSCLQPFHQCSISVASRDEKPANTIRSMAKYANSMSVCQAIWWQDNTLQTTLVLQDYCRCLLKAEQIKHLHHNWANHILKWMLREISKFHSWPLKPMAPLEAHHKIWTMYYSKVAKILPKFSAVLQLIGNKVIFLKLRCCPVQDAKRIWIPLTDYS